MDIAILSDTHIPDQADQIPDQFREHVTAADHVIHAGDFGSKEAFADIRDLAANLTAVYGNADPTDIDLPSVASVTARGVTFVVSHGMINFVERAVSSSEGVVFDRNDWLDAVADTARARADTDEPLIGVGGHSHELEDETHDGVRVLNPGSATGVGPADGTATMMIAEVADCETTVTVHEA
ncbi:metallophosphoesterase family protein [Halomicrococcus sp. NG-SE-24]|uniref:metallophosphoesterase family protein n=1 Tax=Halomicrococcus sp. NG-SE-24 TaxID=3436928 RepID=UPI003D980690